jgi:hypothetical protein
LVHHLSIPHALCADISRELFKFLRFVGLTMREVVASCQPDLAAQS